LLRNIALKSLRDIRRGFLWWSLGLAGFVALIVSVYPTVHSNPALEKLSQDYPEALQAFLAFGGAVDYSSAAGYLGIELFSFMVPLLLLVAAIGTGAGTIAGEEERGTLELLLANPVSRTRVVLEKTVALVLEIAGLGVVLWLALWIGALLANMDISAGHLAAARSARSSSLWPMGRSPSCSGRRPGGGQLRSGSRPPRRSPRTS
jgi:ABC-2 type transport system permease protein